MHGFVQLTMRAQSVQNQEAPFTVETPKDTPDKLVIEVTGPDGAKLPASNVKLSGPDNSGKYQVAYTPPAPGTYKISVTLVRN